MVDKVCKILHDDHANNADLTRLMLESLKVIQADIMEIRKSAEASAAASSKIQEILKAFPAEDLESHRRHHEDIVTMINQRKKIKEEVTLHALKLLTWSGLVGLGVAVWSYMKSQIGK